MVAEQRQNPVYRGPFASTPQRIPEAMGFPVLVVKEGVPHLVEGCFGGLH
jgi:hypothetical protein